MLLYQISITNGTFSAKFYTHVINGKRRFTQSIIGARLHDDSRRMIRALMLLIRASKLLCCLIYFFAIEIKLPCLPY